LIFVNMSPQFSFAICCRYFWGTKVLLTFYMVRNVGRNQTWQMKSMPFASFRLTTTLLSFPLLNIKSICAE
jgi:hypothetical protein